LGDVGVIHQGQGLLFGLEAGEHFAAVHPRLDDLQGHLAADGLLLVGHVHHAHAPFTDLLDQLIGANPGTRLFGNPGQLAGCSRARGGGLQEVRRFVMCGQEPFDTAAERFVATADLLEVGLSRIALQDGDGHLENGFFVECFGDHLVSPSPTAKRARYGTVRE
jgi:hypothetical protein